MPRRCSICDNDSLNAIDLALVAREPIEAISRRFHVSHDALTRHLANHVKALITPHFASRESRESREARKAAAASDFAALETNRALDVVSEIRHALVRVNLLFDACDRWLRDPDNPEQYTLDPRGEDISVIVWEKGPTGQAVQKKRKMSYLLERLDGADIAVERWETKHSDPRELVLKTADNLKGQMEFLSKLLGMTDDRPQVNMLVAPEWVSLRRAIMGALMPFPDARAAVVDSLGRANAA